MYNDVRAGVLGGGASTSFRTLLQKAAAWRDNNTPISSRIHLIEQYLLGLGLLQMADIIESEQDYIKFAEIHDDLGWDNFVEGRISKSFVRIQTQYLSTHTHLLQIQLVQRTSATYPHAPAIIVK